jgi:translation initiation factor 2B subunit (eIF-2B alpha/beta/delta family)
VKLQIVGAVWQLKKELNAMQQQLQTKDKAVQALTAKLKSENQSFYVLSLRCLSLLMILVVVVLLK